MEVRLEAKLANGRILRFCLVDSAVEVSRGTQQRRAVICNKSQLFFVQKLRLFFKTKSKSDQYWIVSLS